VLLELMDELLRRELIEGVPLELVE
jgi:hypothetical protein